MCFPDRLGWVVFLFFLAQGDVCHNLKFSWASVYSTILQKFKVNLYEENASTRSIPRVQLIWVTICDLESYFAKQ